MAQYKNDMYEAIMLGAKREKDPIQAGFVFATGKDPEAYKKLLDAGDQYFSLLLPSGKWSVVVFWRSKSVDLVPPIEIPGASSICIQNLGPIAERYCERMRIKLYRFHQEFNEKVKLPLFDYWGDVVRQMGLPVSQKEKERAQKHFEHVSQVLMDWLYKVIGTLWGRREIKRGGFSAMKRWYIENVLEYAIRDVRVNLSNEKLFDVLCERFTLLAKTIQHYERAEKK